ncbi:MAG: hypothetical protein J0L56_01710 [Chitinophagales bacterium]|nr:hypothetical protein [Chitinophagales bacterium]
MRLKFAQQLSFTDFLQKEYDVLIAASGYETRATTLSEKVHTRVRRKCSIGFKERSEHPQRIKNDKVFHDMKFDTYSAREGSFEDVINVLDEILAKEIFQEKLSIIIDYSCMTKVWYATILNFFLNKYSELSSLEVIFSYSPSQFSVPKMPMPNRYMGPIPGIFRVSASYKPTALILGLGYEKETAKGLMEYLDPQETYSFYSKPAYDDRFSEIVEKNNEKLLASLGSDHVYTHSMSDIKTTDSLLSSLCMSLRSNYRVILAPLGPKPFSLLCLLLATKFPDIDVWRVSSGDSGNIYDRLPFNCAPILCRTVFERRNNFKPEKLHKAIEH